MLKTGKPLYDAQFKGQRAAHLMSSLVRKNGFPLLEVIIRPTPSSEGQKFNCVPDPNEKQWRSVDLIHKEFTIINCISLLPRLAEH